MMVTAQNSMNTTAAAFTKIFERFFRVDKSHSKQSGGTGLGLSIVNAIVVAHDGMVRAYNRTGKNESGAIFEIILPQHKKGKLSE